MASLGRGVVIAICVLGGCLSVGSHMSLCWGKSCQEKNRLYHRHMSWAAKVI
jgi:hypothetical protein